MMTEWKQDDSITFVKNPNYWNPKSQHLDKIVIRFLPDPTARFTAVKTGDIDIFYEPLGKQVIEAREAKTLKVEEYNGTGATRSISTRHRRRSTTCGFARHWLTRSIAKSN